MNLTEIQPGLLVRYTDDTGKQFDAIVQSVLTDRTVKIKYRPGMVPTDAWVRPEQLEVPR